ncbi:MAG: hypothetical protein ACM34K_14000 [Bacillota bacterium]
MFYEDELTNKYRLFKIVEGEEIFLEEHKSLGWASALAHKTYDESRLNEPQVKKIIVKDLTGRTLKIVDRV